MTKRIWNVFCASMVFTGAVMLAAAQAGGVQADHSAAATMATPSRSATREASTPAANTYVLSYVHSDRKWRFGFRSEPFDKVSSYFEDQLANDLQGNGYQKVPTPQGGSYTVSLELLEVSTHPAAVKKPGMDVSAIVTVRDSGNHLLFSKGYRGESRTVMNTYGHLINHAIEDMARNVAQDDEFIGVLAGRGKH